MALDRRSVLKGAAPTGTAGTTDARVQESIPLTLSDAGKRIVTLEEHFVVGPLMDRFKDVKYPWKLPPKLNDVGDQRLRDMDEGHITVQVLSASMPGADLLDGKEGIDFARATNDHLVEAVRAHPNRFAGFAHLPMRTPEAAADELERAIRTLGFRGAMINGTTEGLFLDDPRFEPILARAEALDVPIYIHPNIVPKPVFDTYYGRLPGISGDVLGSGAFGWHIEVAIHVFRLVLSGAFQRHPRLTVIIGHMGETIPFMLDRADGALIGLGATTIPVRETILDRCYITTAGVFSTPAFLCALTCFGADRILFSVDYPYSQIPRGKAWFDSIPISPEDRVKIMHANADRVLKLNPAG